MQKRKLKLKKYPYTYARVAAMRSKLISKEQYHKLIKMELNSIIQYLEETTYKSQIDRLALTYSDMDLIEQALNLNLIDTTEKLRRICPENLRALIDAYLLFYDIENIKTLLRGRHGNYPAEKVRQLLVTAGVLKKDFLISLLKKESFAQILHEIRLNGVRLSEILDKSSDKDTDDLAKVENLLHKWYLQQLSKISERFPKQGALMREFIRDEITISNIKTLLRLKRINRDKQGIMKFMFPAGNISHSRLEHLASLENLQEVVEELKKTSYGPAFEGSFTTERLSDYELALDKMQIKRNFLRTHQHPLTVISILSFMFAKDIEVKNLKTLVKAKQLGISQEYIEEKLLI